MDLLEKQNRARIPLGWNHKQIHIPTYTKVVDVGDQTTCTVANLDAGKTYYFAVIAYNTAGYTSNYSNEVSCVVTAQ